MATKIINITNLNKSEFAAVDLTKNISSVSEHVFVASVRILFFLIYSIYLYTSHIHTKQNKNHLYYPNS